MSNEAMLVSFNYSDIYQEENIPPTKTNKKDRVDYLELAIKKLLSFEDVKPEDKEGFVYDLKILTNKLDESELIKLESICFKTYRKDINKLTTLNIKKEIVLDYDEIMIPENLDPNTTYYITAKLKNTRSNQAKVKTIKESCPKNVNLLITFEKTRENYFIFIACVILALILLAIIIFAYKKTM